MSQLLHEVSYEFLMAMFSAHYKLKIRRYFDEVVAHGITDESFEDLRSKYLETFESDSDELKQEPQSLLSLQMALAKMGSEVVINKKNKDKK